MPEQALQVAFEIKTVCDALSRRLLRWHWEQKPGAHSLESLQAYVEQRRKESPEYYDRMPDLSAKTSWNQLDTTLCMRILLDPEKDAARPVDLLGNTSHPAAARKACNAVRVARNQAAHASDNADGAQAAILFNEAVEYIELAYADTAFKEAELAKYYRQADEFLRRCGAAEPEQPPAAPPRKEAPPQKKAAARPAQKGTAGKPSGKKAAPKASTSQSRQTSQPRKKAAATSRKKAKPTPQKNDRAALWLLAAVLAAGLLMRAISMGLV